MRQDFFRLRHICARHRKARNRFEMHNTAQLSEGSLEYYAYERLI